jgi:hypothetical protein
MPGMAEWAIAGLVAITVLVAWLGFRSGRGK